MGWYPYLEQADDAGLVDVLAVGLGAGVARGRGGGGRGEQAAQWSVAAVSTGAASGQCGGDGQERERTRWRILFFRQGAGGEGAKTR